MDLLNDVAKQFLTDVNADGKIDLADAVGSLQNLLSDAGGQLDVGSIVSRLQGSGLSKTVASWLGDGENSPLSTDAISGLFDGDKLNQFASSLNIDVDSAKNALAGAIPSLIDRASSGGSLLENLTEGVSGLSEQVEAGGIFAKIKKIFCK